MIRVRVAEDRSGSCKSLVWRAWGELFPSLRAARAAVVAAGIHPAFAHFTRL